MKVKYLTRNDVARETEGRKEREGDGWQKTKRKEGKKMRR